jgi:hypothetical protein
MGVGSLYFLFIVFLSGGRGWVVNLVLDFKSMKIFWAEKEVPGVGFWVLLGKFD